MINHIFRFKVGFNGSVTMTSHERPDARIDGVTLIVLILLNGISKP
jgi:hypothetical protein